MGTDDSDYKLAVQFIPPTKQAPADRGERARQQSAVQALAAAHGGQYADGWPMWMRWVDLQMEIKYERGRGGSDSANIIGGIADALERLNVYHSDAQLRRIVYEEAVAAAGVDRYWVTVTAVHRSGNTDR